MSSTQQQTVEGAAFLDRLSSLIFPDEATICPRDDVAAALQPCLEHDLALRALYAKERNAKAITDPHVGLINVHGEKTQNGSVFKTRSRKVAADAEEKNYEEGKKKPEEPGGPRQDATTTDENYILPLPNRLRRQHGSCAVVDLDTFKARFNIFTEMAFSCMHPEDWDGVFIAGGAVLTCLTPLLNKDQELAKTCRGLRKYYHESDLHSSSDIDVFLYDGGRGDSKTAEARIERLAQRIADAIPKDILYIRTKNTISIVSQYPNRTIQIVLRLYRSPAEILHGFDVDCACVGFDGQRVWAAPRALVSLVTQSNAIDITRRSTTYETRLAKYADRSFEVYYPSLDRKLIDPSIYERAVGTIQGLARLLVLEKLSTTEARENYLDKKRKLRQRPDLTWQERRNRSKKIVRGDIKTKTPKRGEWAHQSDYDIMSLTVPYGPNWDAGRVRKELFRDDVLLNSKFNPKSKDYFGLHRHPCFFALEIKDVMEDLCGLCPTPKTDEERELCETKFVDFVNGRIAFMVDDPGKQLMSSSYHPITDTDWTELAYLSRTEALMRLVVQGDLKSISDFLDATASDPNERKRLIDPVKQLLYQRDHAGRSPLHMAIITGQTDLALLLLDRGARMTARLVDGRNCLMLASQNANAELVKAMLDRSMINAKQAENLGQQAKKDDRDAKTDKTDEDLDAVVVADPQEEGAVDKAEDAPPDVLEVNFVAWDAELSALFFAIIAGSTECVKLLLNAGASPRKNCKRMAPISAALLISDDSTAVEVIKALLTAGATCNQIFKADVSDLEDIHTPLHTYVTSRRTRLIVALLQGDPVGAKKIVNFPISAADRRTYYGSKGLASALTIACATSQYGVAAFLVKLGAHPCTTLQDREDFCAIPKRDYRMSELQDERELWSPRATQPLEASMAAMNNVWKLLLYGKQAVPRLLGTQQSFHEDYSTFRQKLTLLDAAERISNKASLALGSVPSGVCREEENEDLEKQQQQEIDKKAAKMSDFDNWEDYWTATHRYLTLKAEWHKSRNPTRADSGREEYKKHHAEVLSSIQIYYSDLAVELRRREAKTFGEIVKDLPPSDRQQQSAETKKRKLSISSEEEWGSGKEWMDFQSPRPAEVRKLQNDKLWTELKTKKPTIKFTRDSSRFRPSFEPVRLNGLYSRLVQAAWEGDCKTIRALTRLEDAARGLEEILDASIQVLDYTGVVENGYHQYPQELNILTFAVQRGQYNAALELAKSTRMQYVTPEERSKAEAAIQKPHVQIAEDDDSDTDDDYDDGEDDHDAVDNEYKEKKKDNSDDEKGLGGNGQGKLPKPLIGKIDITKFHQPFLYLLRRLEEEGREDLLDDLWRTDREFLGEQYWVTRALLKDNWTALLDVFEINKGADIYLGHAAEKFLPVTEVAKKETPLTYSDYPGLLSAINGERETKWAKDVSGADAAPPPQSSSAKDSPSILVAALKRGAKKCVGKLLENGLKGGREILAALKRGEKGRGGIITRLELDDQEQVETIICGEGIEQNNPVSLAAHRTDGALEALKESAPPHLWQRWINQTDGEGMTPLLRIVAKVRFSNYCRPEEIKFLTDNGADLLARDANGKNILHHLVGNNDYWESDFVQGEKYIDLRKWAFHTWLDRTVIQQLAVQECEPGKTALHLLRRVELTHLNEIFDLYDENTARSIFRARNLYGQTILWVYSFAFELKWMLEICQRLGILKEMLGMEDAHGETFMDVINRKFIDQTHRPNLWVQTRDGQKDNLNYLSWTQMPACLDSYHAILNRLDFDSKGYRAGCRTQLPIEAQYTELKFVLEAESQVLDQWPPKLLETANDLLSWLKGQSKEKQMTLEQAVTRSFVQDRSGDVGLAKQLVDTSIASVGGLGKIKRTLVPWSIGQRMTKKLLDEQDTRFQLPKASHDKVRYHY